MGDNQQNRILVIGLFLSKKNKHLIYRTAADQLAELLEKNSFQIVKTSTYVNQLSRFIDIIITICLKRKLFSLAIVPIYGGYKNYLWIRLTQGILRSMGKKVILVIHGGSIPERMKKNPKQYLTLFEKADTIVCPSNFIITALRQDYGIESLLIENVINLNDYSFHPKNSFAPKLFWMRTFEDVYNPLMAVQVVAELKKTYPNIYMVMAGHDRGMLKQTKELALQLGVSNNISFPGYVTNEQKNSFAQELDFYICTNQIDNAPVTLIEMMALGMPVITVDSGGIPYMITDGYNGMLVPYNNVAQMVDKITQIIQQPSLGMKLVANGQRYATQYGEEAVLKKWKLLFESFK